MTELDKLKEEFLKTNKIKTYKEKKENKFTYSDIINIYLYGEVVKVL